MRVFVFNCLLLASVAIASPNGRHKRDLVGLKNMITSAFFGRSQINIQPARVPQDDGYKLFRVPGFEDVMIKVTPKKPVVEEFVYPPAVEQVNLNAFGTVVGTKSKDDTLVAVKGVDNLLSTGILYGGHNNVMKETIVPMFPSINSGNYVVEEKIKSAPVIETRPVLTEVVENRPAFTEVIESRPVFKKLTQSRPVLTEVIENRPAFTEVIESRPVSKEFTQSRPVLTEVVENRPAYTDVIESRPVYKEFTQSRPVLTEVIENRPAYTEVVKSRPVFKELTQSRPVLTEVIENRPAYTDVIESRPAYTEVIESRPAYTEVIESRPAFTEVIESRPAFTEVIESRPAYTEVIESRPAYTEVIESRPAYTEVIESRPAYTDVIESRPVFEELIQSGPIFKEYKAQSRPFLTEFVETKPVFQEVFETRPGPVVSEVIENRPRFTELIDSMPVLTEVARPIEERVELDVPFESTYSYKQIKNNQPVMTYTAHTEPGVEVLETIKMKTELPMCIKKRVDEAIVLGADPTRFAPVQDLQFQYQNTPVFDFSYPRVETNSFVQDPFRGKVLTEEFDTVSGFTFPPQSFRSSYQDRPLRYNLRPTKSKSINPRPITLHSHKSLHMEEQNTAAKDKVKDNSQIKNNSQAFTNMGEKVDIGNTLGIIPPQYIRTVSNSSEKIAASKEKIKAIPIVASKDNVPNAKIPSYLYRVPANPNTGKTLKENTVLRTNAKTNANPSAIVPTVAAKKDNAQIRNVVYTNKVTVKPQTVKKPVVVPSINAPKISSLKEYIQSSAINKAIVAKEAKNYTFQQKNADGSSLNVNGNKHGVSVNVKDNNVKNRGRGDIPEQK